MRSPKKLTKQRIKSFQQKVLDHYRQHGRDLPWRKTSNPYEIFVSEIMLQQTQVDRVIPKRNAFIKKFPSFKALAQASLADVLTAWQGLGYNRRALALKKTAEIVTAEYNGKFPTTLEELEALPGIGPYTARAIAIFAGGQSHPLIETNIRSVYLHEFFADQNGISDEQLMPLIEQTIDTKDPATWYHALMDYGAALKKTRPNPSRRSAHHTTQARFEGSNRQLRGLIIRLITEYGSLTEQQLLAHIERDAHHARQSIQQLSKEGFLQKHGQRISIR